ncbi:hypothetical protein SAMN05443247_01181 [Bradyrhizobium erythrophlei]|jgi:hypothetical protein|nr:hypothetical protein SAMN05443247_01181 [Bradyrhizobium erythrophlei]
MGDCDGFGPRTSHRAGKAGREQGRLRYIKIAVMQLL